MRTWKLWTAKKCQEFQVISTNNAIFFFFNYFSRNFHSDNFQRRWLWLVVNQKVITIRKSERNSRFQLSWARNDCTVTRYHRRELKRDWNCGFSYVHTASPLWYSSAVDVFWNFLEQKENEHWKELKNYFNGVIYPRSCGDFERNLNFLERF